MPIITALCAHKKNKEMVELHLDGEFVCSLTLESVYMYRLEKGIELSNEKLQEVLQNAETEKALQKTLGLISRSMKTEKQITVYLQTKGFAPYVCQIVLQKLKSYKYADDQLYAKLYVKQAIGTKGKRRINAELLQKGIDAQTIDSELETTDSILFEEGALKMAKKFVKNKPQNLQTLKKLVNHLLGRGYDYSLSYQTAKQVVNTAEEIQADI